VLEYNGPDVEFGEHFSLEGFQKEMTVPSGERRQNVFMSEENNCGLKVVCTKEKNRIILQDID